MNQKISPPSQKLDGLFLLALSMAVFFVGVTEFMLSSMLGPLAQAFHTTASGAAWLISSYAFSYAIAAPLLGYFSDRMQRESCCCSPWSSSRSILWPSSSPRPWKLPSSCG